MDTEQYQQPENYSVFDEVQEQLIYASTGQRFLNHLIDSVVLYAIYLGLFFVMGLLQSATGADMLGVFIDEYGEPTGWIYLFWGSVWLILYTVFEGSLKGRTIGKMVTGTRAMRDDGSDLKWKDAILRSLCRFIPFDILSALGGHPWHDTITKTMVVKTRNINA